MQGWRISMEDAHTSILKCTEDEQAMFFGVYDGHGGAKIAAHVSKNLHKHILKQPEYSEGNIANAMSKGFLECDANMKKEEALKDEMSGATAITCLVKDKKLYVANAGDSRAIASIGGVAHALSVDHKPADELERKRIEDAGGYVEFNRVNGNLALSRALGDFAFKDNDNLAPEDQIVSGFPDVVVKQLEENYEFILLACDGIWDVLSNQEVADFVNRRIGQGKEPEIICEELMTRCLASDCSMGGLGCDNMTVLLVCTLHEKPYQKLIDRCAELTKKRDADLKRSFDEEDSKLLNGDDETSTKNRDQETEKAGAESDGSGKSSSEVDETAKSSSSSNTSDDKENSMQTAATTDGTSKKSKLEAENPGETTNKSQ